MPLWSKTYVPNKYYIFRTQKGWLSSVITITLLLPINTDQWVETHSILSSVILLNPVHQDCDFSLTLVFSYIKWNNVKNSYPFYNSRFFNTRRPFALKESIIRDTCNLKRQTRMRFKWSYLKETEITSIIQAIPSFSYSLPFI